MCTITKRLILVFILLATCSLKYAQRILPPSDEFVLFLTNNLHSVGISRAGEAPTHQEQHIHTFDHPALLGFTSQEGFLVNLILGDYFIFAHANYTSPNWIPFKNQALQIHLTAGTKGSANETLTQYLRTGLSWGISFWDIFAIGLKSNFVIQVINFQDSNLLSYKIGLDPSIHYHPKYSRFTSNIFDIHQLDIFFYTQNLNLIFPTQSSKIKHLQIPFSFHFGTSILFFKYRFLEWSTFFDISFLSQRNILPLQIGSKVSIYFVDLRFSFIQNFLNDSSYKILSSIGFEYQDEKRKISFDFGVSFPNLPSTEVYFSTGSSFFF